VWFKAGRLFVPELALATGRTLSMTWEVSGLRMTVTGPDSGTSSGEARLAGYSKSQPVPWELLNLAGTRGYYTLALTARAPAFIDSSTYPQGTGRAALTLSRSGTVKLAGVLADGTKMTASSFLASGDRCPVFVSLATPGAPSGVKGGSLLGELLFNPGENHGDVEGPYFKWFRPEAWNGRKLLGSSAKALATRLYTAGWPEGITVDAVGALYEASVSVQAALGLDASGRGRLSFSNGKLPALVEVLNFNVAGNRVVKVPTTDLSFSLQVVPSIGFFHGTFTPSWSFSARAKPLFQGVILQRGVWRGGWGYFLSNAEGDLSPESGSAVFSAP
jgi:hypothetical protein